EAGLRLLWTHTPLIPFRRGFFGVADRLEKSSTERYEGRMRPKETEARFLSILSEYLVSLPFDLKILQEAVADPDLDRSAREVAAGAIVHTLLPQEGEGPLR